MSSQDAPQFPPEVVYALNNTFFSSLVVEGLMNGLYTALFIAVLYTAAIKRSSHSQSFLVGLTILLYALSIIHLADTWVYTRRGFIFGATPLETFIILNDPTLWERAVGATMPCISIIIADSIMIWRTWMVWGQRRVVVILPMLSCITSIAFAILTIISVSDLNNTQFQGNVYMQASVTFFSLSLATTVICSGLIIYRILTVGDNSGSAYKRIIVAIVESVVLYSITVIIYVTISALESRPNRPSVSFNTAYVQSIMFPMSGIGPTLLILRCMLGLTQPRETWHAGGTNNDLEFGPVGGTSHVDMETLSTRAERTTESSLSPESKGSLSGNQRTYNGLKKWA